MPSAELQFTRPQWEAHRLVQLKHTVCLAWGRGCGKSWFLWHTALLLVAEWDGKHRGIGGKQRGIRIVFLVDTLKHFRDIYANAFVPEVEDDSVDEFGKLNGWAFLGGKVNRTTLEITFPGGSTIKPFPAAEHTSKSALGIRCDVVFLDETDNIDKAVYETVMIPWFSEKWSLQMVMAAGTPRRGRHGLLWDLYRWGLSDDEKYAFHRATHTTYLDSPEIVDFDYVERQRQTMTPSTFKREWMCDFDAGEGQVYDIFDPSFHVQQLPEGARLSAVAVGVDWGYVDPGVMLVTGIVGHGADAKAYLLKEFYEPGRVLDYWVGKAREIHAAYPTARWFADPSQPASIESLRQIGVAIVGADNKIDQGIACVADKLFVRGDVVDEQDHRWTRLYIDPGCTNTLREIVAYRRKPLRGSPDKYSEDIEDSNNHAMDALRYLCVGQFGFPGSGRTEWTGSFG